MSNVTNTVHTKFTGSDHSGGAHRSVQRNLGKTQKEFKRFAQTLGVFGGGVGLARMTKSVVQAALKMQAFESQFRAATGSIEAAASEMEFTRKAANELGFSFEETAGRYAKFIAASQETGATGQDVHDIFMGVSRAARALFLDSEQVAGAFRALEQVMSKGTVQAEEIRGQLGERIPGAFGILAKALDVTQEKLNKMLSMGEVSSSALAAMGRELSEMYGEQAHRAAETAIADFHRLDNDIFALKATIGAAVLPALQDLANFLRENMPSVMVFLVGEIRTLRANFYELATSIIETKIAWAEFVNSPTGADGSRADRLKAMKAEAIELQKELSGLADFKMQPGVTMNGSTFNPRAPALQARIDEIHAAINVIEEDDRLLDAINQMWTEAIESTDPVKIAAELAGRAKTIALIMRKKLEGSGGDDASNAIQKTIEKLKTQIATFGMTEREIANYTQRINAAGEMGKEAADEIHGLTIDLIELNEVAAADKAKAKATGFVTALQRRVEVQTMLNNGLEREVAIQRALEEYGGFDDEEIEQIRKMAGALYDLEQQQEKTNKRMQAIQDEAARSMFRAWEEFFFDPMEKGLSGLLKSFIDTIRKMIAQELAYRAISMLNFGGFFDGILGKRAKGGPVLSGGSYIVGEKGPELFTPTTSGMITPNHALGGGGGMNVSYHIDARGATQELISVLPRVLEENNRQLEAQIFGKMRRGLVPA